MSYVKHQLAFGPYQVTDGVAVQLPESCNWRVVKYQGEHEGNGQFDTRLEIQGGICLVLHHHQSKDSGFLPVMSFLTPDEALELSKQLQQAAQTAA